MTITHDYTPTPWNKRGERWVETIKYDDGSTQVIQHGPDEPVDDTEYSELFLQLKARLAEMDIEPPSFFERLQQAERDLNPIQDEAVEFLEKHGPPAHLRRDDREWDDEYDWKEGRW